MPAVVPEVLDDVVPEVAGEALTSPSGHADVGARADSTDGGPALAELGSVRKARNANRSKCLRASGGFKPAHDLRAARPKTRTGECQANPPGRRVKGGLSLSKRLGARGFRTVSLRGPLELESLLEIFSGAGTLTRAMKWRHIKVFAVIDYAGRYPLTRALNSSSGTRRTLILKLIVEQDMWYVHFGTPCLSLSRVLGPRLKRSSAFPAGLPELLDDQKVIDRNAFV